MTSNNDPNLGKQRWVVRLFVTGDAPNSRIAKDNLKRLRARYGDCPFEIEIIDINQDAQTALDHCIFMTPALQIVEPKPGGFIFGNLSDEDKVLQFFMMRGE
ncbi:MAG: circadian clock KaiB family protein [bacterium]|jgi:circadian clock protein KaiB|nr:circadian clock KaiB family protein [bacterium]